MGPPIVGIGASAGGLEAFERLLRTLPTKTGLSFVLVQHLAPDHESFLPEILARATSIPVTQARDGVRVEPDHAYVIPPNTTMSVVDGHLRLVERPNPPTMHLPVDAFLCSLAETHREGAIGVILSGAGSDGARGVQAIKEVGGLTFAQDSVSARHSSMPEAAVATGCVDFILPPEDIARQLEEVARFVARTAVQQASDADTAGAAGAAPHDVRPVLTLLRERTSADFTQYRPGTVQRRLLRRMLLRRFSSIADYLSFVRNNPAELDLLYDDLLIGVTSFFRDPEVFAELRQTGFPELLQAKAPGHPFRIWVAGCSGGEETYSVAIALLEYLENANVQIPIQIFGTDLSETAIARARAAIYPESIAHQVSAERLRRFFVPDHGRYRIAKFVRDLCVFSRHNIVSDPPFAHLDLISCRNVLIYFEPSLQRRVFPIFHYALDPRGLLLLGSAESPGAASDFFEPAAKRMRIFRRRGGPVRPLDLHFGSSSVEMKLARLTQREATVEPQSPQDAAATDMSSRVDRVVLANFAQHGVVLDERLNVLHFRGDTSSYLSHAPGPPTLHILNLVRPELVAPLRVALSHALANNRATHEAHIPVGHSDRRRHVTIDVFPIPAGADGERELVVVFNEEPPAAHAPQPAGGKESTSRRRGARGDRAALLNELQALRDELAAAKINEAALIEQHESTIEELRAAGEEIQSSNEELQSTNEELETTKEEIQSTNEELTTLNEELNHRNRELGELASDLTNVLASTTIPIIIVGHDLRIRRFTPASNRVMRLIPSDVGRSLSDIRMNFELPQLEEVITKTAETLATSERVVRDEAGHWWSLTIRPYQTVDRRVDGAVLVFSDIDTGKRAEEHAKTISERRRQALVVAEEARVGALARANEALAIGIADRERADEERNVLLRRLESAREDERRRLSRELHDEVGQQLSGLALSLQALSDIAPPDSEIARRAGELRSLTSTLSRELHEIAVRLRPKALDDFGFEAALSSYAENWSRQTGIRIEFRAPTFPERLPRSVENAAYRIAQEALTNIAKHSNASRASVVVERRDGYAHVIIEDDGIGFDPSPLFRAAGAIQGLGLPGIRERVALLRGTFDIESKPGGGTTLFVQLPIDERPASP
jgi:two-component system CheB/CheR fusion protein